MNKIARVSDAASFGASEVNGVQYKLQCVTSRKNASLGINQGGKHKDVSVSEAAAVQGNTITLLERHMYKRQRGFNFDLDLAYSRDLY